MTLVRMLVSAEGEFSLSAGIVYELPEPLASSFLDSGAAETPEEGSYASAITPAVNVPAAIHSEGFEEFLPGAVHGEEDAGREAVETPETPPAPKPRPRPRSSRKPASGARKS